MSNALWGCAFSCSDGSLYKRRSMTSLHPTIYMLSRPFCYANRKNTEPQLAVDASCSSLLCCLLLPLHRVSSSLTRHVFLGLFSTSNLTSPVSALKSWVSPRPNEPPSQPRHFLLSCRFFSVLPHKEAFQETTLLEHRYPQSSFWMTD